MGKKIAKGFVILLATTAAGFLLGRYGLGEGYLKNAFAGIQRPETRGLPKSSSLPGEPVPDISPSIPPLPGEQPQEPSGEQQPPAPAGGETAGEETFSQRYSLQLGSFIEEKKANDMAEEVTSQGYPARVELRGQESDKVYVVLVGSYANEESAQRLADELKQRGFESSISRQ